MQTVKKQMQNDNMQQIQPTTFMFPDGSSDIKLNIDTSNAQGWQLALESSNMVWVLYIDSVVWSPCTLSSGQQNVKAVFPSIIFIYIYIYIYMYCSLTIISYVCRLNQTIS